MKHYLFFTIVFFHCICLKAQTDNRYEALIAEASLFHLQKDYKNAITVFEKAFLLQQPDALNAYKTAGVYALDENKNEAFLYLNLALDKGWTENDNLLIDPYFDFLRNNFKNEWTLIVEKAKNKEMQYEKTLKFPALRKEINLMTINDQKLRFKKSQTNNAAQLDSINQEINNSDYKNLIRAKEIIKKYSWPKISEIGKDGENNFWLIIQHGDQDILFQRLALTEMKKLLATTEIDKENYAFLYDRVQCNLNYKQLYGTQVNWTENGKASGFRPILKEDLVDKRRSNLGLLPLKIYALNYGFQYSNIASEQASKNDRKDIEDASKLITEAQDFYKAKEFQKVYDNYNNASMILGGMSSLQNYDAALLFANIYNQNKEEQYRSIALDFLTLLFYRGDLSKKELLNQNEFKSFYSEKRWIEIFENI
ncbi:hypothetical protein IRZ71_10600 [Flavobacterium sp. ANB]|uniref:DUF6624 domain-containing protein n=1 Tax=unclassified Flavobacterium TaxID=196869 RepID=UPI0012B6DA18|nr:MULTISPECIES: DUF6624 domain-containing protein [unclassified Flavobacterium]MBF4516798.1 hypothetical protein [Flavobacterium sp. ANB]MTD69306.1 hypothetical protein [Flavobacterium sp. LC2016-13]